MRLHFFTVNDIEDYRKTYRYNPSVKKIFEEAHPQTIEELDQAFFFVLQKIRLMFPTEFLNRKFMATRALRVCVWILISA